MLVDKRRAGFGAVAPGRPDDSGKNSRDDEINLLSQVASASSAFVRTKARIRTALQLCRACFACWDAIPIPANITEP